MKIQKYNFDVKQVNSFLKLIDILYLKNQNTNLYKNFILDSLKPKNHFYKFADIQNFFALEHDSPQGHISAMIDNRLPGVGLVGFFESSNAEIADKLIDLSIEYFREKGVTTIRGPIDLSIWHRYRFANPADTGNIFLFEPFNKPKYPEYFSNYGFKIAEKYFSGLRTDFNDIINYTKDGYDKACQKGFKIRTIKLNEFNEELKIIHRLSLEIFKESWSFVPISFEEFSSIYKGIEKKINPRFCEFICDGKKEIGFCFSIPDFTSREKKLIIKTIGVLPEYQGQNLGLALIYDQHVKAKADNFETIVYALMKYGNRASQINPYGAKIFRDYEIYELEI
ncbi:MAG: GNAT family N-acetyltransferase [Minisyncoccia bacterium]